MRRNIRIVFGVILMMAVAGLAIGAYDQVKKEKGKTKEDLYADVELFADAVSIIRSDYVEEVESKKLVHGALKGMLGSLDDFSDFLEPEEFKEIQLETKGEFGGIGIEISVRGGVLTVIAPLAGTPADAAGIRAGDKIVRINGTTTKDMDIDEAVRMMRGDPGTYLTLTLWREKDDKIFEAKIRRDTIKVHSIKKAAILEDKIGYIKLIEFQENTARDLEEALNTLEKRGMDALILDLRNNPGGLLEAAVAVSEKFLPKDQVIVSIKGRTGGQNAVFTSTGASYHAVAPLVVLVNDGSASASEIVAGAIKDTKRGVLVGTKTFGKGSVQTVIPLKDDSALRLTTASYFTPAGKIIRGQGVSPDVPVELEEKGNREAKAADIFDKIDKKDEKPKAVPESEKVEYDNQLVRAIDLIKGLRAYRGGAK